MKKNESKKESGSYYTPDILADFIAYHVFSTYSFSKNINVLEPSAGDGIFFESIFNNQLFKNRFKLPSKISITAVEKETKAIENAKARSKKFPSSLAKIKYQNQDYLEFQAGNKEKFDLVIGNPPYIKSQHLSDKQIKLCAALHKEFKLQDKSIKNIWTSFLLGAVASLNKNGVLCFVLPAELLQVIYAKELRELLRSSFDRIEIFTFNELIFPEIEQDVIILICGNGREPGVSFYHVEKLDDLREPTFTRDHSNIHRQTLDKWTNYILSDSELEFLDSLREKLLPIKNYCKAEVGIVTAANDYFIVNKSTLKKSGIKGVAKPILQKGSFAPSSIRFKKTDYDNIVSADKSAFLLAFQNKDSSSFSTAIKKYLKTGKDLAIDKRYKCELRENWYFVPSTWISEGFFTKRSNIFPRVMINDAQTIVTDAFYRIEMKEGNKIKDLTYSFYNTLTFIFAELEGRYYGGSVLELTPNEFKNLMIPYKKGVSGEQLNKLDKLLRDKASVTDLLNETDKTILKEELGLTNPQVIQLRRIYERLVKRRLKSLKSKF